VRADVSSSVRSILPCTERLYCIPLHTCQHAGALPANTNTSPTPRRRTVSTKYYYCKNLQYINNMKKLKIRVAGEAVVDSVIFQLN
jgi:hypothetical protein